MPIFDTRPQLLSFIRSFCLPTSSYGPIVLFLLLESNVYLFLNAGTISQQTTLFRTNSNIPSLFLFFPSVVLYQRKPNEEMYLATPETFYGTNDVIVTLISKQ